MNGIYSRVASAEISRGKGSTRLREICQEILAPTTSESSKNISHLLDKGFVGECGVLDLGELLEQLALFFS